MASQIVLRNVKKSPDSLTPHGGGDYTPDLRRPKDHARTTATNLRGMGVHRPARRILRGPFPVAIPLDGRSEPRGSRTLADARSTGRRSILAGPSTPTLSDSCAALTPNGQELNDSNREPVHVQHFQKWKAGNPRPIFSRVAVAVSTPSGSQLFEQDQTTGKLAPVSWPDEWNSLHQMFSRRPMGGPPPFENPQGFLFAFPVFSGRPGSNGPPFQTGAFGNDGSPGERGPPFGRGRPAESEWMIFELDTNYLRNTWLPELTRRYLNPGRATVQRR